MKNRDLRRKPSSKIDTLKGNISRMTFCGLFAFTLSASAVDVPTLTLTQLSDTLLTWSWSDDLGGAGTHEIVTDSPHTWRINGFPMPDAGPTPDNFSASWMEKNLDTHNYVFLGNASGAFISLIVGSNLSGAGDYPDGSTVPSQEGTYRIRFHDAADTASVPDLGSTLGMFALSLGALGLKVFRRAIEPIET